MHDSNVSPRRSPRFRQLTPPQLILTLACLASGLALILTIALHLPLSITLGLLGLVSITASASVWLRSTPALRSILKRHLKFGLRIGIVATIAYDVTRWLIFGLFAFHLSPFEALKHFGYSLLGTEASIEAAWIAGFAYHLLNGMLFASAYAILIGGRRWWYGILWALVLEYLMFSIYPGWLNLNAVMDEFTALSLSGHVAYGLVLGIGCQRTLRRSISSTLNQQGDRQ